MNYSARIIVGDQRNLLECFAPEGIKKERSSYKIKKIRDNIIFEIKAKDATALRATINTITQMLTVYEKMASIK